MPMRPAVGGSGDARAIRTEQAQVPGSQRHLIARHQDGAGRPKARSPMDTGVDGARHPFVRLAVQKYGCAERPQRANKFGVRNDHDHGGKSGLGGRSNGPGEQGFAIEKDGLLGPSKAGRRTGREDNGGRAHPAIAHCVCR